MPVARHLIAVAIFLSLALTPVAAHAFSTPVRVMIQNMSDQTLHIEIHGNRRTLPPHATWTREYNLPVYLFKSEQYTLPIRISDDQGRGGNVFLMVRNMFTVMPTVENCNCSPGMGEFGSVTYETIADREGGTCDARVTIRSR